MVSQDEDENLVEFTREVQAVSQVIEDSLDTAESGTFILAASEADYALPLGKVATGRILYIEADGEFTVKLDGEVTGHTIKTDGSGLKAKIFLSGSFTSAPQLTNASSSAELTGAYVVAGDKT
jgi:hypothetical protein